MPAINLTIKENITIKENSQTDKDLTFVKQVK